MILKPVLEDPVVSIITDTDITGGTSTFPELVTNGDFTTNTNGWTATGSTLSAVGGKLVITATGGTQARARQTLTTVVGRTYTVRFKVRKPSGANPTAGSFAGGGTSTYTTSAVELSMVYTFTASATSTVLTLEISGAPTAGDTAEFDDVSVK